MAATARVSGPLRLADPGFGVAAAAGRLLSGTKGEQPGSRRAIPCRSHLPVDDLPSGTSHPFCSASRAASTRLRPPSFWMAIER